jgi:putative membrane protein
MSLINLLKIENSLIIEIVLFITSFLIFIFGTINYFKHKITILEIKKILEFINRNITNFS